ncbi:hypothetical protein GO003_019995 [Methylicorpusculum oleiharenae]|uniref:hypothetical protein n=1 Tax=Methylicorpusculum oleiharenae TaxID=1338687 RepID=UPI0013575528|nr:hypothetical protein [Methylicorpusculum oleiharenae]MCD2452669.1 hypothetical protein [Methylicorpusculum oleiharenae]
MDRNGFESKLGFKLITLFVFWTLAFVLIHSTINKKPFLVWASMVAMVASACVMFMGHAQEILVPHRQGRPYEELRHLQALKNIPFFFNGNVSGNFMGVVWASGREIRHWNPLTQRDLPTEPPLAFMSHEKPSEILPDEILDRYEVMVLGFFDGNFKSKRDTVLSNYISVIRNK